MLNPSFYPTPKDLAAKMVSKISTYHEYILEPSAGHGAISRFFPEMTKNTIVEPSNDLYTQAVLLGNANTKAVRGTFEDLDIHNKFDAITMNPPFGPGPAWMLPPNDSMRSCMPIRP